MAHGRITGWATHLPERRLTNHDLAELDSAALARIRVLELSLASVTFFSGRC